MNFDWFVVKTLLTKTRISHPCLASVSPDLFWKNPPPSVWYQQISLNLPHKAELNREGQSVFGS